VPAERLDILGVPVDRLDWQQTLTLIEEDLGCAGPARAIIAVNPEKVMRAQRDPELLECLRSAALLIPDGIGVVAAARLLRRGRMQRVAGAELMPRICALAAARGRGVYLFGASAEVNERAAAALRRLFPKLLVAGRHHGYVAEAEMAALVQDINDSGAEILFLALGSPRQELWMRRHLPALTGVRVCQGVGGTFDVLAGAVRRAPRAFIRLNLEWLYRLLAQPRRLLRQSALPRFALQVGSAFLLTSIGAQRAAPPGTPK
jgi:N-acetylglucosaminyldiphosphoundecaprenol N-acetyl-beta-D-mannosaminyltransferase